MGKRRVRSEETPGCLFCSIAAGTVKSFIVREDPDFVVFLDAKPLNHGHCLVIPRAHIESFTALSDALVAPLFKLVRTLAAVLETDLGADGSFVAINTNISQSVPHMHVHVVPRYEKDGLFSRGMLWIRKPYANEGEMEEIRTRLASSLSKAVSA